MNLCILHEKAEWVGLYTPKHSRIRHCIFVLTDYIQSHFLLTLGRLDIVRPRVAPLPDTQSQITARELKAGFRFIGISGQAREEGGWGWLQLRSWSKKAFIGKGTKGWHRADEVIVEAWDRLIVSRQIDWLNVITGQSRVGHAGPFCRGQAKFRQAGGLRAECVGRMQEVYG